MKKILIILSIMLMSISTLNANQGYALKHANPMPNLMRIAIGNADILNINKTQKAELKAWGKANKPVMKEMIKSVMKEEKELNQAALTSGENLQKIADSILSTRGKIITMKMNCLANLKKVLTPKQFSQVVKIYKSSK